MSSAREVTLLLRRIKAGDQAAESRLLELVYPHLRQIARRYIGRERKGHTLQPTALVNEAYLQIIGQLDTDWNDRSHFFAVAAQSMRRILVDYARQKRAAKRDGRLQQVELTETLVIDENRLDEILIVHEALERLATFDPRRSKVVELRFFGGMTDSEVADVLQVALRTVQRDWNAAKAWLHGELTRGDSTDP